MAPSNKTETSNARCGCCYFWRSESRSKPKNYCKRSHSHFAKQRKKIKPLKSDGTDLCFTKEYKPTYKSTYTLYIRQGTHVNATHQRAKSAFQQNHTTTTAITVGIPKSLPSPGSPRRPPCASGSSPRSPWRCHTKSEAWQSANHV